MSTSNVEDVAQSDPEGVDTGKGEGVKLQRSFDISRDPSDYRQSLHALQRELRDRKVLNKEMIAEAIEEGSVVKTDRDAVVLRHQWLQTTLEVVLTPEGGVIQTAYEV